MKKLLTRYRFFLITMAALGTVFLANRTVGVKAVDITVYSLREMLLIIPPIFVLLGLLDVWVPRNVMVRYMGEGSGLKGILLSLFLGSAAAGPLYGAFPVAAVFMKKGVRLFNILVFMGAWSTTKIPLILFELSALGPRFALTRLLVNLPGILLIAFTVNRLVREPEKEAIYENASALCD